MGKYKQALRGAALEGRAAERDGRSAGRELPGAVYPFGGNGASGVPELVFGRMDPAKRGRFIQLLRTREGHAAGALWQTAEGLCYRRVLTNLRRQVLWRGSPAFCFDVGALLEARRAGAAVAEVVERSSGRSWRADFERVMVQGELVEHGAHGEQLRLPVAEFEGPPLVGGSAEEVSLFGEVAP